MKINNEGLNKVARITPLFEIMKVLSTTLGEIMGDFFSTAVSSGYTISLTITAAFFFAISLGCYGFSIEAAFAETHRIIATD